MLDDQIGEGMETHMANSEIASELCSPEMALSAIEANLTPREKEEKCCDLKINISNAIRSKRGHR